MPLTETLSQIQDRLGLPPTLGVFMDSSGQLYDLKEEFNLITGCLGNTNSVGTEHMGLPKQIITQNGAVFEINYGASEYQGEIVGSSTGYHKSRFRAGVNVAGEANTAVTWAALSAGLEAFDQGGLRFVSGAASLGNWANGGYSSQEFNGVPKKLEVVIDSASRTAMIGFSRSWSTNHSYTAIDYALYLVNPLQIYEAGAYKGSFGLNAIGDKVSVEIRGNKVVYARNGVIFYESTTPLLNQPYRVDASVYALGHLIPNAKLSTDSLPSFEIADIEGASGEAIRPPDLIKMAQIGLNVLSGSTYDRLYIAKATGAKFTGAAQLSHKFYVTELSGEVNF